MSHFPVDLDDEEDRQAAIRALPRVITDQEWQDRRREYLARIRPLLQIKEAVHLLAKPTYRAKDDGMLELVPHKFSDADALLLAEADRLIAECARICGLPLGKP